MEEDKVYCAQVSSKHLVYLDHKSWVGIKKDIELKISELHKLRVDRITCTRSINRLKSKVKGDQLDMFEDDINE